MRNEAMPAVAVVVAAHNRAGRLDGLMSSLAEQTIGTDGFQLVVVDDGSSDETPEVLARWVESGQLNLRTLRNVEPRGPAVARDLGWRESDADIVAFTDDDCEPSPAWLAAGIRRLQENNSYFVQGQTLPIPREASKQGPFTRTIHVTELDAGFQTCNIFFRRELLERIGGFDVATFGRDPGGEDADLAWRAIEAGAAPVFEAQALVHHAVNELGPVGKLRVAKRWTTPMKAYVRHPGLRRAHFVKRVFWKGSHYLLVRAVVALLLPRRLRMFRVWLVTPYVQEVNRRRRTDRGRIWLFPYYLVHDLVECWAIARAAIRYRHPMI